MDVYLRIGLLVIAACVLFLIFLEPKAKRNNKVDEIKEEEPALPEREILLEPTVKICMGELPPEMREQIINDDNNYLAISIFAQPDSHFAAYDLLQAISAAGLQFGDMNIFHCYSTLESKRVKLFSLASATKPGEFNLDRMGDFSCIGLTLFMDLEETPDPEFAFDRMLKTAEQLAEDLDGDLYAAPRKPWTLEMLAHYKHKITQHKSVISV